MDPQEMKEGSEHLNPIIFGQLGPFWSQNSNTQKKIHFGKQIGITYHTALYIVGYV